MFRAICRSPLLHVFDLETDPFEALIADLEQWRLVRSPANDCFVLFS
jgi:hypothetical protein